MQSNVEYFYNHIYRKGRFSYLDRQSYKLPGFSLQLFLRYALCLFLFVAPFLRGLFLEEYFLPFSAGVAVLFLLFIYDQYKNKESGFFNKPLDWAILALLLAYLFSLFAAVNIRAAVGGLMKYVIYFMIFWMCYRTARQEKWFNYLCLSFYISGVGMAILGLLFYSGIVSYPYVLASDRIAGTLEYSNTFGAYLAVVSMLGWALAMSKQRLANAALNGANTILILTALGSLSRGTWVLYPIAALAYILLVGRGKRLSALVSWLCFFLPALVISRWVFSGSTGPSTVFLVVLGFCIAAVLQLGIDFLRKIVPLQGIAKRTLLAIVVSGTLLLTFVLLYATGIRTYITQSSLTRLTDISLRDENIQARFEFNRDAIKIVKDHPIIGVGAGGWEALYHQYASHLYWTSKTHNYFLQTWVEAGTFGFFALLAVWLAFIHILWKHLKKPHDKDHNDVLFWGGAIAVFLLGAHSLIDFDMSYPSIAFVLFGLMGALQSESFLADGQSSVSQQVNKKRKNPNPKDLRNSADLAKVISATIVALVLLISATSFWLASINFRSAQKILNKDPNQALILLNKSMQYDPLNASYIDQTANFYVAVAASTKSPTARQQALEFCQKAVELEPYNIKILNNVNRIYLQFGQLEQAIKAAEVLIQVNPHEPSTYENLANTMVLAGLSTIDSGQMEKARSYWNSAINVASRVPPNLTVPAIGLNYTSGQAMLLLGNGEKGEETMKRMLSESVGPAASLQRIEQVDGYRAQARLWLAAYFELSNRPTEAKSYFEGIPAAEQEEMGAYLPKVKGWLQKATQS